MKVQLFYFVFLATLIQCVGPKMVNTQPVPLNQSITLNTEDCAKERKGEKNLSEVLGVVKIIADTYVIVCDNPYTRYHACNMPQACKKENIKVVFSGMVKEVFPYERRFATPFVLQSIEVRE